jgi:hypothetical protein
VAIPEIATSEFNYLADFLLNLGGQSPGGADARRKIESRLSLTGQYADSKLVESDD